MANVTPRDSTQFTVQDSGQATATLPAGSVAGDLLVAWCEDGGRRSNRPADTTGWTSSAHAFGALWCKRLTAADITAGTVDLLGEVTGLVTCVNAAGINTANRRDGHQITRTVPGAAVIVTGFNPPSQSTINPTGDRLDSVVDHEDWPHSWWFLPGDGAAGLKGLSGVDSGASYYAWEILPIIGPTAPTLSTPLAGAEVDEASAVTLSWVHNSTSGQAQAGYAVRYREVGITGYWLYIDAFGFGNVAEQLVTSAAQSAVVDASVFAADTQYEWSVKTQDEGTFSDWSASQAFWARSRPTVTDVVVTSSAEDLTPLVTASWTMGYGSVAWWRVWVTLSAASAHDDDPVYDSGVIAFAWTSDHVVPALDDTGTVRWTNGGVYRAWVQVGQAGGLSSDPTQDASTFTVSWTPPAAPTGVSVIDGAPPRVIVEDVPTGCGIEVQWTVNPGAGWDHLSTVAMADVDEEVAAPLAPYGVGVWARARSLETIDGVPIPSTWTTSSATVTTDTGAYLVSDDGSTWIPVRMLDDDRAPLQGVTITVGHGATAPRVDSTPVAGWRFRLTLTARTQAQCDEILGFLTTRPAWWCRWAPENDAFGLRARVARTPDLVARADRAETGRVAPGPYSNRLIEIGCVTQ